MNDLIKIHCRLLRILTRASGAPLSLTEYVAAIEKAKKDDNISAIYVDVAISPISLSKAEILHRALTDFQQSGKPVYAYGELYTQNGYLVVAGADHIALNPKGYFGLAGLHSEVMFFKGTFDKLGIEPQLFRVGKYKSFGEPFIRTDLSEANREQITSYLNSLYDHYLILISEGPWC